MKNAIKYLILIAIVAFLLFSGYKSYNYQLAIANADNIFSQHASQQIEDWYNADHMAQFEKENRDAQNQPSSSIYNPTKPDTQNPNDNALDDLTIPTFTNGVEAYMFAEKVLGLAKGLHVEVDGVVNASFGVKQTVKNIRKRDEAGNIYGYSASHGTFAKLGQEMYYNGRQLKWRKTSNIGAELVANFNKASWQFSSVSSYRAQFGLLPDELNYIVNANTVISEKNFKFDGEFYTFVLTLNPATSTQNYKHNVRATAGAKDFPNFKSVEISVVINKDARFQSITYNEVYTITAYGITAQTSTNLVETFPVIGAPVHIPVPQGF